MEEVTVAVVIAGPAFGVQQDLKSSAFLVNQLTGEGLHLVTY